MVVEALSLHWEEANSNSVSGVRRLEDYGVRIKTEDK